MCTPLIIPCICGAPEEEGLYSPSVRRWMPSWGRRKKPLPDAAFFITADHGMNFKRRCWDLGRACAEQGLPLRFALSPERDYYIKHHRNFAGSGWVWLKSPGDLADEHAGSSLGLAGVEEVITREEAVARFRLPA